MNKNKIKEEWKRWLASWIIIAATLLFQASSNSHEIRLEFDAITCRHYLPPATTSKKSLVPCWQMANSPWQPLSVSQNRTRVSHPISLLVLLLTIPTAKGRHNVAPQILRPPRYSKKTTTTLDNEPRKEKSTPVAATTDVAQSWKSVKGGFSLLTFGVILPSFGKFVLSSSFHFLFLLFPG